MNEPADYLWMEELYQEELFHLSCKTLVVVPEPWEKLTEADKSLLSKILSAVKVGLAGARIIAEPEFTRSMLRQLNPRCVIVFGSRLEPPLPPGEVHRIEEAKLVNAPRLDSLDEAGKKLLWPALKEMYSL